MRIKYTIPVLIVIVLALSASVVLAATTSLTVNDANGSPGSTVEVPLNIAGASDVGAMQIVLTYNSSVLSVSSVEKGELTENSMLESNKAVPGILAIGIADTDGINGDGVLAVMMFSVIGELGDTSPLTLETVEANDVDTLLEIPTTVTSGTFTVTETVTEEGGPSSSLIIGIIAAVVILIAVFVVLRKRKKVA